MTTDELHALIAGDAQAKALADAGNDSAAAARAAEIAPAEAFSNHITERSLYAGFVDPAKAEEVLQRLEQAAASNPVVRRALKWLSPAEGGLDVGHVSVRAMIDTLVSASVLTPEQATTIKSLGERPQSFSADEVSAAWLRYRPDGRIAK